MRTLLYCMLLLLASSTCSQAQELNLKAYFFPYADLFEAKVYQYVNEDNPNDVVYQWTQSRLAEKDTLLILRRYDEYFQELETMTQRIHSTGVTLTQYSLYVAGDNIKSRVLQDQIYQWQQAPNEPIKWSVRYASVYGDEGFRKMRQVISTLAPYRFQKKMYPVVQFKDDFRHSVKRKVGVKTTDFHQYSSYAQGLGLVAYDRTLPSGKKLRYRLEKIMDLATWEVLQKRPQQAPIPIKRT